MTFWPRCINTHLSKGVAKIPYVMQRDFGYDATLVCYRNGEYPIRDEEVPLLDLEFIENETLAKLVLDLLIDEPEFGPLGDIKTPPSQLRETVDGIRYLRSRAKDIDVLHLQGLKPESVVLGAVYRLFNPEGTLYLRPDISPVDINNYEEPGLSNLSTLKRALFDFASFDVVTVETAEMHNHLEQNHWIFENFSGEILQLPNCTDVTHLSKYTMNLDDKMKNIIHVGRIGAPAKGSETLLRAFVKIADELPDWNLILLGTMTDEFRKFYDGILAEHRDVADQILYPGFISERDELYTYYRQSKIVAMPSRFESFSQAMVESAYFGNVVVGTEIASIREFTENGEFGYLSPVDDVEALASSLKEAMSSEDKLRRLSKRLHDHVSEYYDWTRYCEELDAAIQ